MADTPYLVMDLAAIEKAYAAFNTAIRPDRTHYAVKCNPHDTVLHHLHNLGCSFEIASQAELVALEAVGVSPADIIFSNPVKVPRHIQYCVRAGVWRFAFDNADELRKLAVLAPGSAVYVRIATEDAGSQVPSEGKFGVGPREATDLLLLARHLGLRPYGITFHVGSQMIRTDAWTTPIRHSAEIMRELRALRIQLSMLNIGGGYPATYNKVVPDLGDYGHSIGAALHEYLPYEIEVVAEPGRALMAEAGVMVAQIIGVASRFGRTWIHLDLGAFNGMLETLETRNQLVFPVTSSITADELQVCSVTGPSCDSQDTLFFDIELPRGLETGDYLFIHSAGAYTTSYASRFNGFDIPETLVLDSTMTSAHSESVLSDSSAQLGPRCWKEGSCGISVIGSTVVPDPARRERAVAARTIQGHHLGGLVP